MILQEKINNLLEKNKAYVKKGMMMKSDFSREDVLSDPTRSVSPNYFNVNSVKNFSGIKDIKLGSYE